MPKSIRAIGAAQRQQREHHVVEPPPVTSTDMHPANVTVERVVCHALAHPTLPVEYQFYQMEGERVLVVRYSPYRETYVLPVVEARELWKRLKGKGYELQK